MDTDRAGRIPLHYAAFEKAPDELRAMLTDGDQAHINMPDHAGMTPMHFAARRNRPDNIAVLLDHGADIEAEDNKGDTPLFHATRSGGDDPTSITLLLERGADPRHAAKSGSTPPPSLQDATNRPNKKAAFAHLYDYDTGHWRQ